MSRPRLEPETAYSFTRKGVSLVSIFTLPHHFGDVNPRLQRRGKRPSIKAALEDRLAASRYDQQERWQAINAGMETVDGSHPIIARMNEVQHLGQLDCRDGVGRIYQGKVGNEPMYAQVSAWQGDFVISFWPAGDGRMRRVLVSSSRNAGGSVYWIAIGIRAIWHSGKYAKAAQSILALRAREQAAMKGGA